MMRTPPKSTPNLPPAKDSYSSLLVSSSLSKAATKKDRGGRAASNSVERTKDETGTMGCGGGDGDMIIKFWYFNLVWSGFIHGRQEAAMWGAFVQGL